MILSREDAAMKLARNSYPSFAKVVVQKFSDHTTEAFGDVVKEEMVMICSDSAKKKNDLTNFFWDLVWSEVHINKDIMPHYCNANKPVICMIICIILKYQYSHMCLAYKMISMSLFGNYVHKTL